MANRTALHEDDRMVAVLACDGRRQAHDESRLGLARHLLETVRRQVMALVDDHMAVLSDAVIDDAFPDETLNDGDIEQSGRAVSPAADSTDRFRRHIEERREPLDPLVEQLPPMHEHERVDAALRDEPRGDDRLAKRRRGGQYASLVRSIASAAAFCCCRSSP